MDYNIQQIKNKLITFSSKLNRRDFSFGVLGWNTFKAFRRDKYGGSLVFKMGASQTVQFSP